MWNDPGNVSSSRLDLLFFSPVRSRVLLFVTAVGVVDMSSLTQMLGIGSVSALYAVNHWEREHVVASSRVGRRRLVWLDPTHPTAQELKQLLVHLVSLSEEYRGLRAAGRSRMRPILKETARFCLPSLQRQDLR